MNTYLGACITLNEDDMNEEQSQVQIGFIWKAIYSMPQKAQGAINVLLKLLKPIIKVACLYRMRGALNTTAGALTDFIANHADLIFGNEDELLSLFPGDFEAL